MRIYKIESQHRRDFQAVYVCDHCGVKKKMNGYDDADFHQIVIPNMVCSSCGKTAAADYAPLTTKYAADVVI